MYRVSISLIIFLANPVLATSYACDEKFLEPEGVTTQIHEHIQSSKQLDVYFPGSYEEQKFSHAHLDVGELVLSETGSIAEMPLISTNVDVRDFESGKMVRLFVSQHSPVLELRLTYGSACPYTMIYRYPHNKKGLGTAVQPPQP